jgi:tetratricopeptide (TPR) repeat protein
MSGGREQPRKCVRCGGAAAAERCPACELRAASQFVHHELVVLLVLGVVVTAGLLLTRAVARTNEELRLRDARVLFGAGERELAAGRAQAAVSLFRRAAAIDRDREPYRLALARALVSAGQDDAARQALMGIRQLSPENPDANLQLARLEARQGDRTAAMRYYQSALHGTLGADQQDRRREMRVEFIRYLLAHNETALALSELLILSGNLPDQLERHLEAGRLFLDAGDFARALDHFRRAQRLDAESHEALAGAGEAAFHLGDYAAARRFLRAADLEPARQQARELLEVADLVLERDPLRPRLTLGERRKRLTSSVAHVMGRIDACLTGQAPSQERRNTLESLRADIRAWEAQDRRVRHHSVERIEAGLKLVHRAEEQTAECASSSPLDRALLLIARRHEIDGP